MRQIAFFSQKGECGKTTSCVNIAAALAKFGRRVLIVDLDSNACASRTFNVLESLENSVAAALLGLRPLADVTIKTEIDNIWLSAGATDLHTFGDVEGILDPKRRDPAGRLSPLALKLELAQLNPTQFEYVLLDCPGGHPFIEHLVLLACDEIIIPTGLSVYDLYAATPAMHLVLMAREARGDGKPDLDGPEPSAAPLRQQPLYSADGHRAGGRGWDVVLLRCGRVDCLKRAVGQASAARAGGGVSGAGLRGWWNAGGGAPPRNLRVGRKKIPVVPRT
jgi:cellulose biosynthesis protein BcsQ